MSKAPVKVVLKLDLKGIRTSQGCALPYGNSAGLCKMGANTYLEQRSEGHLWAQGASVLGEKKLKATASWKAPAYFSNFKGFKTKKEGPGHSRR